MDIFMPNTSMLGSSFSFPTHDMSAMSVPEWVDKGTYMELMVPCNGYTPESIKVEVCDVTNTLSIKGVQRRGVNGRNKSSFSYSYSQFTTKVNLPSGVNKNKIVASVASNGNLVVQIQKNHHAIGMTAKRRIFVR